MSQPNNYPSAVLRMQLAQYFHDFYFEPEIDRLPLNEKLAQYAHNLALYREDPDMPHRYVDILRASLSTFNALKEKAPGPRMDQNERMTLNVSTTFEGFFREVTLMKHLAFDRSALLKHLHCIFEYAVTSLSLVDAELPELHSARLAMLQKDHPLGRQLVHLYRRDLKCSFGLRD